MSHITVTVTVEKEELEEFQMKGHVHELDSSDHTTFEILRGSHPQDMALKIQVPQFSPSPRPLASSTVTALSSFLMSILDLTKKKAKRRRSLRVSRMIWKKFSLLSPIHVITILLN